MAMPGTVEMDVKDEYCPSEKEAGHPWSIFNLTIYVSALCV